MKEKNPSDYWTIPVSFEWSISGETLKIINDETLDVEITTKTSDNMVWDFDVKADYGYVVVNYKGRATLTAI